jgi:hypothetical protein
MSTQAPNLFEDDPDAGKPGTLDRQALREVIAEIVPQMLHDIAEQYCEGLFVSLSQEMMTQEDLHLLNHNIQRVYDRQNPRHQSRNMTPTLLPIRKRGHHGDHS